MLRIAVLAAAIAAIAASSALAARLSGVRGSVLVNNQAVTSDGELKPGDRVKVISGGVKIVYDNGAIVGVVPGQTVLVLSKPPEPHSTDGAGLLGDVSASLFSAGGTAATVGYAAGGAAIAGGAGLAAALSNIKSPAPPLSP